MSNSITKFIRLLLSCLLLLMCTFVFSGKVHSANQVTVGWDKNTDQIAVGYKVYYGNESGNYQHTVDVGDKTTFTLTNVSEDQNYFFAVTAYDAQGHESGFSKELVCHTISATAGPNGSIIPGGITVTSQGSSQTFTIKPNSNYHIEDVLVDGASVGALSAYQFSNVARNHRISASFAANIESSPNDNTGSASTVYEDAEDGATNGWIIYTGNSGAKISNVLDEGRQSRVIELTGSGTQTGYRLGDESLNSWTSKWQNKEQFTIQWSMKYSESFVVYADVETTAGHRYIWYTPEEGDKLGSGEYVHHGLGSGAADGKWHTFVRDLQADLKDAQPDNTILEVNAFLIRGSGRVDDIALR